MISLSYSCIQVVVLAKCSGSFKIYMGCILALSEGRMRLHNGLHISSSYISLPCLLSLQFALQTRALYIAASHCLLFSTVGSLLSVCLVLSSNVDLLRMSSTMLDGEPVFRDRMKAIGVSDAFQLALMRRASLPWLVLVFGIIQDWYP